MKNVLVFPCGSEIGLELHRSICHSTHFRLFGASTVPDHGRFVYSRYITLENMVDDPGFEKEFNRILVDNAIDLVIPAHDSVVVKLAEMQDNGRLNATAIVSGFEVTAICRSKKATYRLLADVVKTPTVFAEADLPLAAYPLFGKPNIGQGSKGAAILPDYAAAKEKLRREPDTVIMQYLPGDEFTVDCFTDTYGQLLFLSGRSRGRIVNGISASSRRSDHPSLIAMGQAINSRLRFRGAWFFQAKEDGKGEAVLLEIAPRIAGSSGFQRVNGVNLALLSLFDRMGVHVSVTTNEFEEIEVDRALCEAYELNYAYTTAYIDFDDTLFSPDRGVDTDVVKFIFQCHNRGIRVILLTRHAGGDLNALLKERRLDGLFTEVIHIGGDESKAGYITEREAVFIDDSFAERVDVREKLGIPVFDLSSLDALLSRRV